jgi:ATP-dependent DNA helicase DinG
MAGMWCDGAMVSRSDPACDAHPTGSPHDGAFDAARPDGASTAHDPAADAVAALARVVAGVSGGVRRREQERLAAAVASAVDAGETLVVEAPTGVGKSLGYLVPTVLADRGDADGAQRPVVVATATKALQQQLVEADLPRLAALDHQLTWATAKGRANYLCRARLDAIDRGEEQALFTERVDPAAWDRLRAWAEQTTDGDRAHAPAGVTDALWAQVSVSANECPGARRCPFGDVCHAEHAKARAAAADVVVTNQHVLLLDAAVEGALLPPPAVTVVDEAHRLVETAGSVFGCAVGPGRLRWLARRGRAIAGEEPAGRVAEAAEELAGALAQLPAGERVTPAQGPLAAALATAESAVSGLRQMLRGLADDADGLGGGGQPAGDGAREGGGPDAQPASSFDGETTQRAIVDGAARTLLAELAELGEHDPDEAVAWVEAGDAGGAVLRLAPIEVAGLLGGALDTGPPVVLTSATLSVGGDLSPTIARWGLPSDAVATEQIASPFDHARQGRLFVPKHLPDPRRPEWEDGARELTWRLLAAAGGRSLVLFTSWRRLHDTADWLAQHHAPWTLLRQGETAPHQLIARFRDEEASVLLATMSFWEGVDAPGDACLQVIIDKLPFPRRDDPLLAARRERAEASERSAFSEVDLPLAAVRLAQGAGRLIRSADDAGVVAVLDPRLATAGYRSVLLDSMPPLTRTIRVADVEAFLATHLAGA